MRGKSYPRFTLAISDGVCRLWQALLREATACDANLLRKRADVPVERGPAEPAEMPLLIVILRLMVEGIDLGLALA